MVDLGALIAQHQYKHRKKISRQVPRVHCWYGYPLVQSWSGWQDLSYEKSMSFAVRHKLSSKYSFRFIINNISLVSYLRVRDIFSDRICTTNEGKSGGLVFHHEQAQTPLWPSHIFFCCLLPAQPGDGGETGIVSSHLVYQELLKRHPGFIQSCETHGVKVRRLPILKKVKKKDS